MKAKFVYKIGTKPVEIEFVGSSVLVVDEDANLHTLESESKNQKSRNLLKTPLTKKLQKGSCKIKQNGQIALIREKNIEQFSLVEATNKYEFDTTNFDKKLTSFDSADKFIAISDSRGFLTIGSLDQMQIHSLCSKQISSVKAMIFSSDSRWLFVGNSSKRAYIYDLLTHKIALEFETEDIVSGGMFLPDGKILLVGENRDLYFYSWYSKGALLGHISLIKTTDILLSHKFVFAFLQGGAIALVDTENYELIRVRSLMPSSVVASRRVGSSVVVADTLGHIALFEIPDDQHIASIVESGDFASIKKAIDQNIFTLFSANLSDFLTKSWQSIIFPKVLKLLEDGKADRAKALASSFVTDAKIACEFREAIENSSKLVALKDAYKKRDFVTVEKIINQSEFLNKTIYAKLYKKEWQDAYDNALMYIKQNDLANAKNSLNEFVTIDSKSKAINNLISFASVYLEAYELISQNMIRAFFELIKNKPILKSMPHYEILIEKAELILKEINEASKAHDYKKQIELTRELAKYAPFKLDEISISDQIKTELKFLDAVKNSRILEAFKLADENLFLNYENAFATLFAPFSKLSDQAKSAADRGDSAGVMSLMESYYHTPLLIDTIGIHLRVAYINEMRNVLITSAVDWHKTFDNYTRFFGFDPLISKLADDMEVATLLSPFTSRSQQNEYKKQKPDAILVFKPLESLHKKPKNPLIIKLIVILIITFVGILTLMVFAKTVQKPLESFQEHRIKESPYKLFENIAKEQNR